MKLHAIGLMAALCLAGTPMLLTGCDREVSHTEQSKTNPDGSVSTDQKTVEKTPDGGTKTETEQSKTATPPANTP